MSSTLFKKPSAWWHLKQSLSLAGRMVISLIFLPCVAVYVIGAHSLETLMASSFSSAQRHKRPVVLITGASSGIGRAAALHLAKLGCEVFSGVRNQAAMDDLKKFDRLHPIILDVTKSEEIAAALNQVQQFLAEDDLIFTALVNNAGIGEVGAFETLDAARSDRVLQVNLHGMVSMTRTFLPLVRQSKGRIVNVGSGFGRLAAPGYVTYSASKFAIRVLGFSLSLRQEMEPLGVSVSLIEPGATKTRIGGKTHDSLNSNRMGGVYAGLEDYLEPMTGEGIDEYGASPETTSAAIAHAILSRCPRATYFPSWVMFIGMIFAAMPSPLNPFRLSVQAYQIKKSIAIGWNR